MSGLNARIAVLLAALAVCGVGFAARGLPPQTSDQSAVAVTVTPRKLDGPVWEFAVSFNTHTQELKDDLLKSAVLIDAGGKPVSPIEWRGELPNGHHWKGILRFHASDPAPGVVELRINRPGEPGPRSFKWQRKAG
jgi:hypothetical protein